MHELEEMKQMGLSVLAISEVTGYDRKTVRIAELQAESFTAQQAGSAQEKIG